MNEPKSPDNPFTEALEKIVRLIAQHDLKLESVGAMERSGFSSSMLCTIRVHVPVSESSDSFSIPKNI